jgi:catechol 2,3-dioxygenase-like lactoylglutathione lyase family enzyme
VIAKRLDNIDVICSEIEPMRAFYGDLLGLPLRLPYEAGQGWVGFSAGDVVIYLIKIDPDPPHPLPHPPPRFTGAANPPGIDSFAFEVQHLDAAIAELDTRGVSWAGEIVESEWYRYRGLHDPEGNLVYLTEPLLDRSQPPVPAPEQDP